MLDRRSPNLFLGLSITFVHRRRLSVQVTKASLAGHIAEVDIPEFLDHHGQG